MKKKQSRDFFKPMKRAIKKLSFPWNTSAISECVVFDEKFIALSDFSKITGIGVARLQTFMNVTDSESVSLETADTFLSNVLHWPDAQREQGMVQLREGNPPRKRTRKHQVPAFVNALFEQCQKNMIAQAVTFMESTAEWKKAFNARYLEEMELRKKRVREEVLRREEEALFIELVEQEFQKALPEIKKSKKDEFITSMNHMIEMTGFEFSFE